MKKNLYLLASAISTSLLLLSGCASATPAQNTAIETQVESSTETAVADTETAETSGTTEIFTETDLSIPLRIWGSITDVTENTLVVDNQSENSSKGEIIFNLSEDTLILDAVTGLPVSTDEIQLGAFEAYPGAVMTMSLPPQTTPELVVVNIPADFRAPQYLLAAENVQETEEGLVLNTADKNSYVIAADAEVVPYLTRNIVTVSDIAEGSRLLAWFNTDNQITKLMLFPA